MRKQHSIVDLEPSTGTAISAEEKAAQWVAAKVIRRRMAAEVRAKTGGVPRTIRRHYSQPALAAHTHGHATRRERKAIARMLRVFAQAQGVKVR